MTKLFFWGGLIPHIYACLLCFTIPSSALMLTNNLTHLRIHFHLFGERKRDKKSCQVFHRMNLRQNEYVKKEAANRLKWAEQKKKTRRWRWHYCCSMYGIFHIACNSTQSPEGVSSVEGLNMLNCTITAGCEWHQSFLQLSDIMHNIFQHLLHTGIKVASTEYQQFLHSNLSK